MVNNYDDFLENAALEFFFATVLFPVNILYQYGFYFFWTSESTEPYHQFNEDEDEVNHGTDTILPDPSHEKVY